MRVKIRQVMIKIRINMLFRSSYLLLLLCIAITTTSGQSKTSTQSYMDSHRVPNPIKQGPSMHQKSEHKAHTANLEQSSRNKQIASSLQPLLTDGTFRVTLNDAPGRYIKLDNVLSLVDRIAYTISKPVAVLNVLKYVFMVLSSFLMSAVLGTLDIASKRHYRMRDSGERQPWLNLFAHISPSDFEGIIELVTRNYDELLNRAGFTDSASCRERSLCVLGDMMACDFPNLVVTVGRFAQQHLPPIDTHKNKYTKALILGLNQTDCDRAYHTNFYDCPSFKDYVRSYFHNIFRRRREYHHHWRD